MNSEIRSEKIQQIVVTAEQMRTIENRIFSAGMPVAALMEKVALKITQRLQKFLSENSITSSNKIGILVGPGHNGGDGLVVARELYFLGYPIIIYSPFSKRKELTEAHANYAVSLGIPVSSNIEELQTCDVLIDGLFGFGLERPIAGELANAIDTINTGNKWVISIDLPSGIHTDTGEILGTAIRADLTLCLGLWKQAFLQEVGLDYIGIAELIDFDIPLTDIQEILGKSPFLNRITSSTAIQTLPLPRSANSHKYKNGHLLIIAGSKQYTGAAILAGLGARASGIGMLSIAVPNSIKSLLSSTLPEALIIGCPETENGAILKLPEDIDLRRYQTIACGPGLTPEAHLIVETILTANCPIILDADALNILSKLNPFFTLSSRQSTTIITPHLGEFKRLFPELIELEKNKINLAKQAAELTQTIIVLKGARTCIATPNQVWINPDSTPALGRGGSGDVLTGLLGGLLPPIILAEKPVESIVNSAVWWHSQAGILAAKERTELGVDAYTLTQYLIPALRQFIKTNS
ncbi:Bifunctional NAD(P)H-hydrate repair enzyme Nnr [Planktothrix tepida]|uniref:Bifunctional NAD(P)H-hydrate repair enzyme n=1 Tax=Planktothrix tepida PCC 9214 TaxID=671072 RepID=A0A1J1LIQ5_9CYAN|nr:bifunctional ADP-dependent NAD(P)H-hydrate dehydratase/NAD(P)H-hydrate epimerase [Planktothrix tepida]CAD5910808.1 Bifunctional NAD(P)H-hydrate repair enzyme Nnr [Planktothrix tepida]CUR32102.1 Bifunctional NAD(P)H-hydrate repair enzyme Nnr (Includes: ADP-dependent (S)-NAD(P)H-hydrate dehydratase; NAD(P)H-hydrate epimerase) [Planktothrix tepida PCC 9214]